MHTVDPGIWRENSKMKRIRNSQNRMWNMARNTEKAENEKHTL